MLKHWLYGSGIRVFHAEGGDGGGGGEGGDVAPGWVADYPGLAGNADAVKAVSKYDSAEKALLGAADAQKVISGPYRLPKDMSKLSDEQRVAFGSDLAKLRGAPESVDGYAFNIPEGINIDSEGLGAFQEHCLKRGYTVGEAQELLDLQIGLVGKLNEQRAARIQDMTQKNYDRFVQEQGSEENAKLRMGWVKEYLQTFCLGENGQPDPQVWEEFSQRILHEDRIIELPLLRALSEPAKLARAGGGAPGGDGAPADLSKGALAYPEMKKK